MTDIQDFGCNEFARPTGEKRRFETDVDTYANDQKRVRETVSGTCGNYLKCSLCSKLFSGYIPYEQHVVSQKHRNKLSKMIETAKIDKKEENYKDLSAIFDDPVATQIGISRSEIDKCKSISTNLNPKPSEICTNVFQFNSAVQKEEISYIQPFVCSGCQLTFNGPISYKQHLDGKKHKKQIRKLEMQYTIPLFPNSEAQNLKIDCQLQVWQQKKSISENVRFNQADIKCIQTNKPIVF